MCPGATPREEFRLSNPQTTKEKSEKDKKVRVFELAKQLGLASKDLVALAQELGFTGITGQLNGLEPDQVEALRERVKKGPKSPVASGPGPSPAAPAPAKPTIPPPEKLITKIQTLPKPKAAPPAPTATSATTTTRPTEPAPTPAPAATTATPTAPTPTSAAPAPAPAPAATAVPAAPATPAPAPAATATPPAPAAVQTPSPTPTAPAPPAPPPAVPQNVIPPISTLSGGIRNLSGGIRNLNAGRPATIPTKPVTANPPVATPAQPGVTTPAATTSTATTPAAMTPTAATTPTAAATAKPPAGPGVTAPTAPTAPTATTPAPTPTPQPTPAPATAGGRPLDANQSKASASPSRSTPPNVIPTTPAAAASNRPAVLNRVPQVPPPKHIAPARTPAGQAPPPVGGGSRPGGPTPPQSGSGGASRPGATTSPPRPGSPPGSAKPVAPGSKPAAGQPMKLTPEMIERLRNASARGQKIAISELAKPQPPLSPISPPRGPESRSGQGSASRIAGRSHGPGGGDSGYDGGGLDDEERNKKKGSGVIGRDSRHRSRQPGGGSGSGRIDRGSIIIGAGGVETIDERFGSRRGPRQALLNKMRRRQQQQAPAKEGRIEIALPITVRSLSETIGMKVGELTKRLLKETNQLYGINSTVDFDTAALIAIEKNIELVAKKQETKEDLLLERYRKMLEEVDPDKLVPRPPIVTIMGHVDHGKTSLLDKIRQNYGIESDVVSTEAGGITQVIRAWSVRREVEVEREDGTKVIEERRITFLDTPGHEAFTKMRARGANVTDIAVIVVAATDGVMPQTQEAISHARAAGVKIIVAINKIDMPNANVARTRQQLYAEGLIPDDMGGDVQFVETSAVTGQGISELLDTIVLVAEVEQLKADPDRPAAGTCLEAYMSSDEGVMATVLIQQGTLKKGDIVLCGSTYGRVRAMYNDMGTPIKQAGPSTPVRITGLNRVPNADDPFYVVEDLAEAQEIAESREQKEREQSLTKRGPQSLDSLKEASSKSKITELKVILKAEARGSIEAIRKELEKLVHDEVRTRVLHAGIGAISESDVMLALTSPEDTLVIGFNVTADDAALKLAEERGISIREYDIIYKLTDDVKAALEGRLKPVEEVVHLGRAVVRETFKISKVGTIAGCFVTSGTIERGARVRVIRQGVVVYPPSDKVAVLESLKRFKDDVREVREGFECGLKISGFDDVKVDDVIEAFKIEVKQRTL